MEDQRGCVVSTSVDLDKESVWWSVPQQRDSLVVQSDDLSSNTESLEQFNLVDEYFLDDRINMLDIDLLEGVNLKILPNHLKNLLEMETLKTDQCDANA